MADWKVNRRLERHNSGNGQERWIKKQRWKAGKLESLGNNSRKPSPKNKVLLYLPNLNKTNIYQPLDNILSSIKSIR